MKVFGIVGWKNSGKTGLMERLITEITIRGFRVSAVKHAHHAFDVDQPGKDSHRHRVAGAVEVLLSSRKRWALMHENRGEEEPDLDQLLGNIDPVDLVLIEGYKRDTHPKVEAHRGEAGNPLIALDDTSIRAVASDAPVNGLQIPVFDLNDTSAVADFVLQQVGLEQVSDEQSATGTKKLNNDCFSLPSGVDWMPVDQALANLKTRLRAVVDREPIVPDQAMGRVLVHSPVAIRSNPPCANSAVDGYGFAHSTVGNGAQKLPLVTGRSAAGAPFEGEVPAGNAVRILTGAMLPVGVDTVVLQEDVKLTGGYVAFDGQVKPGANAREAGEDVLKGRKILHPGQVLRAPDIALIAAVGCVSVNVHQRLKVGVLSTGDEIVAPGSISAPEKTYDANRPMLLNLVKGWGYEAVDLGQVSDDRQELRAAFDNAHANVDVVLTSGGVSAGDEDHVSALLKQAGTLNTWRIAIKPGRPLALGQWQHMPVFGLPGNPVAALLCTLIFARPALSVMAGGIWSTPVGFSVPAAFEKRKKPGRREYLRAKLNHEGRVETFQSEGSGRISGLSWADGLVELEDGARHIRPGDMVRYIPYASFGI